MNDIIPVYLLSIQREFETGKATEHSYRPSLKSLIEDIDSNINAINEPKRQKCGAPDYILTRKDIPVGFIEAKDIGINLDNVEKGEQMSRYLASLDNLVLTDYLDFRFFIQGKKVDSIRVGHLENGEIVFEHKNIQRLENLLKNFVAYHGQTIKSAPKLAKTMAGKARLMKDVITKALQDDDGGGALRSELDAFRQILIHDMTEESFADMYAQTIAYGLFAARLHDKTLDTFTRQEAAELLPKTNPFLRKLFHTIAGPDLDTRIVWIVDALADVFRATDIEKILASFSSESKRLDPFIHFYETFLSEYDPKLRKSRGVWYTPEPVVKFIVNAVDDILKKDFNLPKGLADTSMTNVEVDAQMADGRYKDGKKRIQKQIHRVQILDPATGTGTFLAEVIRKIHSHFDGQAGIWESYVNEHLLPRIHGFELLMAPYAMCHLKLDLLLTEFGYKQKENNPERLSVYLTNSLEEAHPDTNTLFSSWLSNEANEANRVKKETPVMVVIGNPPYSGESSNKGDFIMGLMDAYKKEPGGKEKLKERNPKWINDDYVKFIRFSEYMIEKNGDGVLGFITNHGYLDNPTFRGMRWHLLKTFDKIYILDLHGNSKRKEVAPDGGKDENVFDIQQGVSIILAVKNKTNNEKLAEVYHADLYGKRQKKYDELMKNDIASIDWTLLKNQEPNYPFVKRDFKAMGEYKKGFSVKELFLIDSMGITSGSDKTLIAFSKLKLEERFEDSSTIHSISYRPFDGRFVNYDEALIARSRRGFMQHMLHDNYAIALVRRSRGNRFVLPFIVQDIVDKSIISTLDNANIFPIYTYEKQPDGLLNNESRDPIKHPNFSMEIVEKISNILNIKFVADYKAIEAEAQNTFTPLDTIDYIYGFLYSPSYREKFQEFLKIDFPRVPYPKNIEQFRNLVKFGAELRSWHLMRHPDSDKLITQFQISGSGILEKKGYPKFIDSKVYINKEQYFDNVPEIAWNLYLGGYQPAQKWLKDRRGRELSFDDILHWQKIIIALANTDKVMKEIDKV